MLDFQTVLPGDRGRLHPFLYGCGIRGCEYSFLALCCWTGNRGGAATVNGRLCFFDGEDYCFPVGNGSLLPALRAIRQDAAERGRPFALRGLVERDRAELEQLLPGKFTFTSVRDEYDYLYPIEQLSAFAGRKMQGKRNHVRRFEQAHPDWKTIPLTEETLPLCREFAAQWYENHDDPASMETEKAFFAAVLDRYTEYEMLGLLLWDGERVAAFAIGNRTSPEVFNVDLEKADPNEPGAYPMICRELAKLAAKTYPEVRFLNREDDMGLPGLRKSKESYHPEYLVKYRAEWIGGSEDEF